MKSISLRIPVSYLALFAILLGILPLGLFPQSAKAAESIANEYATPTTGSAPYYITSGPDGNLWFTENSGHKIAKITTSGVITEYDVTGVSPHGITSGPDGNLWFTENNTNKIGKITTSGVITEYVIPTSSSAPEIITSGPDGNLWFTESNTNKIAKITTTGTVTEYTLPSISSTPYGIAVGPDGNLWFTENSGNRIGKITTGGAITEYPLPIFNSAPLNIVAGPDGNLWFTEFQQNKITKISISGDVTEYGLNGTGTSPNGIAVGPDGNLWYSEAGSTNHVSKITTAGVISNYTIPSVGPGSLSIVAGPDGNMWFTETSANKIGVVSGLSAPTPTIYATQTVPNATTGVNDQMASTTLTTAGVSQVKASIAVTVATPPAATQTLTIGACTVTFATTTAGSPSTQDLNCSDNIATINTATTTNDTAKSPVQIAADLESLAGIGSHGGISVTASSTDATTAIFATAGTETSSTTIAFSGTATASNLVLASSTTGVIGVAQVNTVTVGGTPEIGDTYSVTLPLDGVVNYIATTTPTSVSIAAGLASAIRATPRYFSEAFSVVASSTTLVFTAKIAGTNFTQTSSVANRTLAAQQVIFTPASVTGGYTYSITINATKYDSLGTVRSDVLFDLGTAVAANTALSCVRTSSKLTCTSAVPGTAFTYSASAVALPPMCTLVASPTSVASGSHSTLTWTTTYVTSISIDNGVGAVSPVSSGSIAVSPASATTYTATVTGPGGSVTCTAAVNITTAQSGGGGGGGGGGSPTVKTNIIPLANPSVTSAPNKVSAPSFTKSLGLGSTGADVSALQRLLASKGLYKAAITGYFGPSTVSAVAALQSKNGLTPVGSVGPKTLSLLNQSVTVDDPQVTTVKQSPEALRAQIKSMLSLIATLQAQFTANKKK
jgi:streptogramin lyase